MERSVNKKKIQKSQQVTMCISNSGLSDKTKVRT